MKTTLLFATLTAGLNQAGVPQVAELTYLATAALALTHGGPAIVGCVATIRRRTAGRSPAAEPSA